MHSVQRKREGDVYPVIHVEPCSEPRRATLRFRTGYPTRERARDPEECAAIGAGTANVESHGVGEKALGQPQKVRTGEHGIVGHEV